MIRILHAADLHLDSPFQSLSARQAAERRAEQRRLVTRIVQLAEERADMLVFAGDVFDSDAGFAETARSLEKALAQTDIPVFFAPGNHDWYSARSPWDKLEFGENVHIFRSEDIECVKLDDLRVRVWGCAFGGRSRRAPLTGFEAEKDGDWLDVMVLHGEVGNPRSVYAPIQPEELERSGMDYVALGHSHTFSGLQRAGGTYYAWPGCAEGRGFDECGEKGVILAELEPERCRIEFTGLGGREYAVERVDLTEATDELAAVMNALRERSERDICRVILTGETDDSPDTDAIGRALEQRFYAWQLRDETTPRRALWEQGGDDSLRALFVQRLRQRLENAADDAERRRITLALRWGLRALDNGEEPPV